MKFNWFTIYFIMSGLFMFVWVYVHLNFSGENSEANNEIADAAWGTGLKRDHIKYFMYFMSLLFGWVFLPYEIITSIIGRDK